MHSVEQQWITRRRRGKGFAYYDAHGQITDKAQLAYIGSLHIPPAWNEVTIAVNKQARILAVGTDAAGRRQYIYHPEFRARQDQAKFERILRFARALPHMRKITDKHLHHQKLDREKVLACVVRIMDEAYMRVGNDVYAKEHQSYGLTTLRSKHTTVQGDTILFDYIGKGGQHQVKKIANRSLARIVKRLDELPGYEIFKYYDENGKLVDVKSADVNMYIKELMGEEFSAKDFRTWAGTILAATELAEIARPDSERERKKAVTACVKKVAHRLGNTPAIARSSYIDPRIIQTFMDTDNLSTMRRTITAMKTQGHSLSPDEQCVLGLLEKDS